ncbi:MAG: RhuM family protein [Candidatus Omnitrophica bacterium]|jgi:hypothetical protein|nr:RhuM family protein [Candidatus Omnitrophota bacterium]
MKDWEKKLDEFLAFNERKILPDAGSVSKQEADDFAKDEYDRFAQRRREYKEAIGQEESIKQLEETATKLGWKKPEGDPL